MQLKLSIHYLGQLSYLRNKVIDCNNNVKKKYQSNCKAKHKVTYEWIAMHDRKHQIYEKVKQA